MAEKTRIAANAGRTPAPLRRSAAPGRVMIGGAQDPAEAAADSVADRVMRMTAPAPVVMRKCAACAAEDEQAHRQTADEEEEMVMPKRAAASATVAPGAAPAAASPAAARAIGGMGSGRPMASAERAFFEPRFGADFSPVRIHDGPEADRASRAIGARAFAMGTDIAFAKGEYTPGTATGRRLMAHELAHVDQQRSGRASRNIAQRASVTLTSVNCTNPAHARMIAEGIAGALAMAHTATTWFLSFNPRNRRRIEALLDPIFMSTSDDVYEAVRDRVISTAGILRDAAAGNITFICAPATDTECGGRNGYVRTNRRNEVNICTPFFNLSLEERKWMIMHEAAHLAGAMGPEIYYADFGTVDCSLQVGQIASTRTALQNADSYARLIWCLTRPSNTILRPVTP